MGDSLCRKEGDAKPRLILADDHEDLLQEICGLLAPDFEVVRAVRQGSELVEAALDLRPDVVVSDIHMPGLNGIEAARQIRNRSLCDAVILLSVSCELEIVRRALQAGVRGYVVKADAGEELISAIHSVLAGNTYFSSSVYLTGCPLVPAL